MVRKEDLISKTSFILNEEGYKELQLFGFIANDDNPFRISISNDLETELIRIIANGVRSLIVDKEYEIVDFSSADERKDKYYRYDLDDIPERMAQMSYVIGNHNIVSFDLQHHRIDEVNSLLILVSNGKGLAFTVYKHLSPVEKVVKSTKQVLARFGIGEDYLTEVSDPLLKIGPRFQIIYVDNGNYIFLESSSLEAEFKLYQVLKNEAASKIELLENTHIVKDLSKIKHYAETPAFCRKLVKVLHNSKVIRDSIPKQNIIDFIKSDEELHDVLKVVEVDGEQYLKISSQNSAQKLLGLLNDEYVYSALTNQKYQAIDKDER